jgi:hypothetical protein
MKLGVILLAALALIGTGCNTLNYSQYQVKGPVNDLGVRAAISSADRGAVVEIAANLAAQFRLKDMTASSLVPNTLAYFVQIDVEYPMSIRVFTSGDQVIVDTMQSNPGGETRVFRDLRDTILSDLQHRFNTRVYVTPATTLMREKPRKAQ